LLVGNSVDERYREVQGLELASNIGAANYVACVESTGEGLADVILECAEIGAPSLAFLLVGSTVDPDIIGCFLCRCAAHVAVLRSHGF
jgi:hypothetical protein